MAVPVCSPFLMLASLADIRCERCERCRKEEADEDEAKLASAASKAEPEPGGMFVPPSRQKKPKFIF